MVGFKRVELRMRVEDILHRDHVLKAVGTAHGRVVFGPKRKYLLIFVKREKGFHGRVGEHDLEMLESVSGQRKASTDRLS